MERPGKKLKEGKTLDCDLQNAIRGETEKRRNILKIVVNAILFCVKNNIALRGTSNAIRESRLGTFLSTLELISNYHSQLAEHFASVKAKKVSTSYFSPQIQNEIISIIGDKYKMK